jgi:hypothetical protein
MKDKAGINLKSGDLIIYGHALGRCAGLQYGKILEIVHTKTWNDKPIEKVRVQGVDTDWDFEKPRLLRPSCLQFSERILKITQNQMPKEIRELLK